MGARRELDPAGNVQRRTLRSSVARSLAAKRAFALAAVFAVAAIARGQDVLSSNRRFAAHLKPSAAGTDVEVVDLGQGGRSAPIVLWDVRALDLASSRELRLSNDGHSLAAIDTKGAADRPLVRIYREGKVLASLSAKELGLPPAAFPDWLEAGVPNALVRESGRLDLLAWDQRVRSVDLATGSVTLPVPEPDPGKLRVEPSATVGQLPYVSNWLAPEVVLASEPLRVHVRGNLPTPAHAIAGFSIEHGSDSVPTLLLLSPRMRQPESGVVAPQVLQPFDETASLFLGPGEYQLRVGGKSEKESADVRPVRVLHAGTACSVQVSGGIAGTSRFILLFDDGRVLAPGPSRTGVMFLASDARRGTILRAIEQLPAALPPRSASSGADMFAYDLAWVRGGQPMFVRRDDQTLEPQLRELVSAMDELSREADPTPRYTIDSTKSFLSVKTGSAGLLSAFGHDHKIMVRRLSGRISADPRNLTAASVVLEIDAGSLAVVDDESAKDRAEIEKEMNANVLEVEKHPTIRFDSRTVEVKPLGRDASDRDLVVEGDLTLHGKTRRIRVPGRLEIREDSLRFHGKTKLLQTDYGIEPTSAAAGTVNVADEVRITFDVTATRSR